MEENQPITGAAFRQRVAERMMRGDTKTTPTTEDEAKEYEKKTRVVQARADFVSTVDNLQNPPSLQEMRMKHEQQMEEERRRAQEQSEKLMAEERERIVRERQQSEERAQQLQEQTDQLKEQLQAQRDQMLMDKLNELKASRKPMEEQLDEYFGYAERLAQKLGFEKPQQQQTGADPRISIELEQMKLSAAREDREFQWRMEQDRRKWEVELKKLDVETAFKQKELDLKEKQYQMLASAPEVIGNAFARGIMERGGGAAPSPQHVSQEAPRQQAYQVKLGAGSEATLACPTCQAEVSLGADTETAKCVSCNTPFIIDRQGGDE